MRIEKRHDPSFSLARLHLDPGEAVRAESGAMAMHSLGVTVEASMQGGMMKALKRSVLGGESLFLSTFRAHPQSSGWVDVAARLPGDVTTFEVTPERGIVLTRGSWLAAASGVEIDTKWGGVRNLFGGEGGFIVHCTGVGPVVAACYGALDRHDLADGQGFTVDSGHLVAYDESITIRARTVSSGLMQTLKSGEGMVIDVTGPGSVWTQSRSPGQLVEWLTMVLPFSRS